MRYKRQSAALSLNHASVTYGYTLLRHILRRLCILPLLTHIMLAGQGLWHVLCRIVFESCLSHVWIYAPSSYSSTALHMDIRSFVIFFDGFASCRLAQRHIPCWRHNPLYFCVNAIFWKQARQAGLPHWRLRLRNSCS